MLGSRSVKIIARVRDWFMDYRWPDVIRSDGWPQFRQEFAEFGKDRDPSWSRGSPLGVTLRDIRSADHVCVGRSLPFIKGEAGRDLQPRQSEQSQSPTVNTQGGLPLFSITGAGGFIPALCLLLALVYLGYLACKQWEEMLGG